MDNWDAEELQEESKELAELPPQAMAQWISVVNKGGKPHFESPEQEYLLSPHTFDRYSLLRRWQGMGRDEEIHALFDNHPFLFLERQQAQDRLLQTLGVDFTDPNYKRAANAHFIVRVRTEMEQITSELNDHAQGIPRKMVQRRRRDQFGQWEYYEEAVFFSPKEIDDKRTRYIELLKTHQLLTDQATEIMNVQGTVSIRDMLFEAVDEELRRDAVVANVRDVTNESRMLSPEETQR